jgi:subtilisin family serine protease
MRLTPRLAPRWACCTSLLALALLSLAPAAAAGAGLREPDCGALGPAEPAALDLAFADALVVRLVDGRLTSLRHPEHNQALQALQREIEARVGPLVPAYAGREAAVASVLRRAADRTGAPQPDLLGLFTARAPASELQALGPLRISAEQRGLLAYSFLRRVKAPPPGDLGSTTPDYTDRQDYLDGEVGINAQGAWALGYHGEGIGLADVEYGWNLSHEDLMDRGAAVEAGQTVPSFVAEYGWDQHGTAVFGELGAAENDYGVTGIAYASPISLYPEWSDEQPDRRPAAIASAVADHVEGDVVLLEMQLGYVCEACYGPAELDPSVWRAVRAGVDAGVVIVAAAGNGGEDLDGAPYSAYLDRGDSGAILVGAGSSDGLHDALSFSTHGAGVHLQGWGEDVFTTGYGWYSQIDGSNDQAYINAFSGTSSASPIVAGAAALVQSAALALLGAPLSPAELRALLIERGRPQGVGAPIGPAPDVIASIQAFDADLDGVAGADWGGEDCDDGDPRAAPGRAEVWYDGVDNDCLGGDDFDQDDDGYAFGDDCDDQDPAVGRCKGGGSGGGPVGCASAPLGVTGGSGAALALLLAFARRGQRRDRGTGPA